MNPSFLSCAVFCSLWSVAILSRLTFIYSSDKCNMWQRVCSRNLPSHSIGMLPSIYSCTAGLAGTTIRLARRCLPRGKKKREERKQVWLDGGCSSTIHIKCKREKCIKTKKRRHNALHVQTHTHTHTHSQRDDSAVTGHGWLPRGPRALLLRSRWVAPNLG